MHSVLRITSILLVLFLVAGCASTQGDNSSSDRSVLTQEQLREGTFTNVYQAVATLRPRWLRTRGTDSFRSPTQVQVYLGNARLGGIDQMRSIGINDVQYIRYYDANEATSRWGLDHGQGAIYLATRRGGS